MTGRESERITKTSVKVRLIQTNQHSNLQTVSNHGWLINIKNGILALETTAPVGSPDNQLPVVFEATEDPSLTNLSRSDANCDKTGTCYDGTVLLSKLRDLSLSRVSIINSVGQLQGHQNSRSGENKQAFQWEDIRTGTIGNVQR